MTLTATCRLLKRLTPRNVALALYNRLRGAWVAVVSLLARLPLVGRLTRYLLLVDQVSLREVAGNARHGVSELTLETMPEPVHFARSRYGPVIDAIARFFDGTPLRLNNLPEEERSSLLQGRLVAVTKPSPGLMYNPAQRYHCILHAPYLDLRRGGSLCTANTSMVVDYIPLNRKGLTLQKIGLYGRIKPRNAPLLEGHFTSIWGKWAHVNYYHWLIECLPQLARLGEMHDSPPMTLLMPQSMPPAWEDSLACCLPPGMAVQRAAGWVRPQHFVFVSPGHPGWAAWLAVRERDYMRGKVFERYGIDANRKPARRIFVSRSRAAMRRLVNEDEAGQVLAQFGFETVHLEGLNFEQQVRLFHDAEFVAGAHGAAFANLLFAGPAKVLELFARDAFKPLYFFLARSLGLDHEILLGSAENQLEDFSIDVTELDRTVEKMLSRD